MRPPWTTTASPNVNSSATVNNLKVGVQKQNIQKDRDIYGCYVIDRTAIRFLFWTSRFICLFPRCLLECSVAYLPLHPNGLSNPGLDVVLESRIYRRGQYVLLPGHRIEPPNIASGRKEYDACYNLVKECVQHVSFSYNPPDPDSFRESLPVINQPWRTARDHLRTQDSS